MAPAKKMTDYERKRLDNIRRNGEMMAALSIQAKLSHLSAAIKPKRRVGHNKKSKTDSSLIVRKSLRVSSNQIAKTRSTNKQEPSFYRGSGSDQSLRHTLLSLDKESQVGVLVNEGLDVKMEQSDGILSVIEKKEVESCVDLFSSMNLRKENAVKFYLPSISVVKFLPCNDVRMIVTGNKGGNVVFWNVDGKVEEGNGLYLYRHHSGPVSGISVHQSCLSKIYSSCDYGFVRLMDAEKEVCDLVYTNAEGVFSVSQQPDNMNVLYFGGGHGKLSIWDERTRKLSSQWNLHENRINTIDFNSQNPNIMATSSTDGTACLWDLRNIRPDNPQSLKTISHQRVVHSAYFSPSGSYLATTSADDTVAILNSANLDETSRIYHMNKMGVRGIWGWDDSSIFIGNVEVGVDVISCSQRTVISTLKSRYMTVTPCTFDAHPYYVGMLAGATRWGHLYIWAPN
ncbi:uncharacterized protein LOC126665551 [Mercurialis annua]|uniref:uncharacterized protein LOC126665551 n=1 Tax=Mercurialis annua TaxID=3986 RepID=UPI0021601574|nr:uncharacterized protein LOC126665551 [Mercurialis annua]